MESDRSNFIGLHSNTSRLFPISPAAYPCFLCVIPFSYKVLINRFVRRRFLNSLFAYPDNGILSGDKIHFYCFVVHFAAFFSPWWINLEPSPDCHFSRCQSMPPDVKSWTTFFTNYFLRFRPSSSQESEFSLIIRIFIHFHSHKAHSQGIIFVVPDEDCAYFFFPS